MSAGIEVLAPGPMTTVQDLGRPGFQRDGVPVGGVMDEHSHRMANWLVGNTASRATLEITFFGLALRFKQAANFAICGADLGAELDGLGVKMNSLVAASPGSVLSFTTRTDGIRAYLAVSGGFAVTEVMGSASTYIRGGFGGVGGRALKAGDILALRSENGLPKTMLPEFAIDTLRQPGAAFRIIPGREWSAFTSEARNIIARDSFQINMRSDRMGYRLDGASLCLKNALELQSEPVSFGTIQVPPDGLPIVLMADRQTTGGYPRIANVVSVDLPRLSQAMPGDSLNFEWISLTEAQAFSVALARVYDAMRNGEAQNAAN